MTKVLVAEDDKYLANAYRVKLTKAGFDILLVSNGEELFLELEKYNPDIILLDLMMPKVDGFIVLQTLRNTEKWKNIPVIITSNLGQKEDIEKGMQMGATDYIVKSNISINDVVAKINANVKQQ
jgi:two-component system phosphate regulon response regulator PhoB/two-component system alkaline phosphatase synthesis response regulator PhoP